MNDEVMDGGAEDDILDKRSAVKRVVMERGTTTGDVLVMPTELEQFVHDLYVAAGLA